MGIVDTHRVEKDTKQVITLDEIRAMAAKVLLTNLVVEKDYALGWLLWGIHQHPQAKNDWVFKGGTCLKKCYFETYRFSEDLDFSYRGIEQPTVDGLTKILADVSDTLMDASGMEFPKNSIQFEIFKNPRGSLSIQGGIKYRGPVRPNVGVAQMQRIKIDITLDEPLVLSPTIKKVDHPYSDTPAEGISILSYCYEEVFAEKVRALAQRLRPRDLYDVIHLYRRMDLNPDRDIVQSTLMSKCVLRGIPVPTYTSIETHENRAFLESEWENQLKHQIPVLPDFPSFLSELPEVLAWIEGEDHEELEALNVSERGETEFEIINESVESLVSADEETSYLDRIRFAAANRLRVRLGYNEEFRLIEPYALARSSDGNLLLRAIRSDKGEARTYRWDRIESVEVTENTFAPQYAVEITSAGHLPIHQLSRNPSPTKTFSRMPKQVGPTYVYQCSYCNKIFRRKTRSSKLNAHKDKNGYRCPGRIAIFERVDY
jgi:predicted nucleotidyltransferase component of viral defense system